MSAPIIDREKNGNARKMPMPTCMPMIPARASMRVGRVSCRKGKNSCRYTVP